MIVRSATDDEVESMPPRDPLGQLKKCSRRQKSDVAQKLVSMCLHELSSRLVREFPDLQVNSRDYLARVRSTVGSGCAYCLDDLESIGSAHVEHLDAMNRWRGGLHVAGNVVMACKTCNNAKRQDDKAPKPPRGDSGWDSFLGHDGSCAGSCPACGLWQARLPQPDRRISFLLERTERIRLLRSMHGADALARVGARLALTLETLYRDLQNHAEVVVEEWANNHWHLVSTARSDIP